MIGPGAMLGVIGGGQLARMFALAAQRLGYRVAVLDQAPDCPAAGVADELVCAPLDDPDAWQKLARLCRAVTIETENVPPEALHAIGARIPIAPDAAALAMAQDRIREKALLSAWGIPVAPYAVIHSQDDLRFASEALLPGVLKRSRSGYDGKGQRRVTDRAELAQAFAELGASCVLEALQPLEAELSVILARDRQGRTEVFPIPMNRHRDGILDVSLAPAPLPEATLERARGLALEIARRLNYCGVLCVEFFLREDGALLVNEIAPRPHNSGHFTIEACAASQFEQQVRALAGLPLGSPRQHRPAAMANLLGALVAHAPARWDKMRAAAGASLHLYGKRVAKPGRKMGHITCVADSAQDALSAVLGLREALK